MKDLLSKDHYCYKIHTLLMKPSAYNPPSIDNFLYGLPPIYKKILSSLPLLLFFKNLNPTINKRKSHYVVCITKIYLNLFKKLPLWFSFHLMTQNSI